MNFTHNTAGTPPAVWTKALDAAALAPVDFTGLRRLVVVAAHPDDETLGAGGLIAAAAAIGVTIEVLVATDGEASHPDSPTHTPDRLGEVRRAEVVAAVTALAPGATLTLLHLPDGHLSNHLAVLTEDLRHLLQTGVDGPTWVVSPWIGDGHPDHEAAGSAAIAAAARMTGVTVFQYPLWAWHWGTPERTDVPLDRLRTLSLTDDVTAAKRRALAAHTSQTTRLSDAHGDEALLPDTLTAFFDGDSEYFLAPAAADTRPPRYGIPGVRATTPGEVPAVTQSLDQKFFDEFYGDRDDPWQFETRWYEERKRDLTMASLPRRRFRSTFEPGCSIGVQTEALAGRTDRLLAADIARQPLDRARRRLAAAPHVSFAQLQIPQEWPSGSFDLIVLSEIGYYCGDADLDVLIDRTVASLDDDGVLVACHWRHPVAEYPLAGDEVHRRIHERSGLALLASHLEADFRLEVFVRPPAVSVAGRDGLVG
ncbi:MAG: bifunctional PIG-L family deacetylase/class I SAM-dependent methyltransferase [Nakamurella sp.]